MKKLVVSLMVLGLLGGAGLSSSFAQMYISGNLGLMALSDSDLNDGFDTGEISYDAGFGLTGAIGSSLDGGARVEVELGYRGNDMDRIKVDGLGSADIDGDTTALSLMGNLFYDFSTEGSVKPFIGAGLGIANVDADIDFIGSEDDTVFAFQFAAGLGFAASETLKVDLQYRFFVTEDPEFEGLEAEYVSHGLMIGLRHSF